MQTLEQTNVKNTICHAMYTHTVRPPDHILDQLTSGS